MSKKSWAKRLDKPDICDRMKEKFQEIKMEDLREKYEVVIGLEVHAQLKTKTMICFLKIKKARDIWCVN